MMAHTGNALAWCGRRGDWMIRAIGSSALFVWFMRWRFRGLKARRWNVDWIRGHYPDKDVQILDFDV